ncbi:hypothetical protein Poli38472_003402 [Pythium oligandrum]|uniref:Leucine-rich repeat-containing N-terminal plant-type domain-containing protein n=1 Tax=Pythium oligandrum TaxID=41045 RepID=A0A8K1C7K2_PYTOL|nr:hypothetical protein Poli38472_003402 [Pythium oligandrum]|eukprot:TMW57477.1 hypothetical protein Poli38472_003402 [Pythium oligandrum]
MTRISARGALKILFWATEGANWKTGWDIQNERSDPCFQQWYGITCDEEGHILSIRLPNNNLVGYLPVEFSRDALDHLQELDLSSNYLSGSVPSTMSRLVGLRVLRLDRNFLTGLVPATLSSLIQLEYLELQGNQLTPGVNGRVVPDAVQALAYGQCHIIA